MRPARVATAPTFADIAWIMRRLRQALPDHDEPAVEKIAARERHDAFHVLISTLLSARTQDATTLAASQRLFGKADSPEAMARLSVRQIERLIYPVSFYRHKAIHVRATCARLLEQYGGRVPDTMEALLTLPGVGRKTANLVLILAHGSRRNICVDTHVHRISNRLGWVSTRTPEETEQALYRTVPKRWWPDVNLYLVTWGQNVCRPVGPRCQACVLAARCPRVGVSHPGSRRAGGR
jgi:endonuclease-3